MSKIAIVTDSNSGITQAMGKELGVYVIPMPFYINEELFFEDISLSQEEFYQKLGEDAEISTSQPSPGDVMDLWEKLLEEYDGQAVDSEAQERLGKIREQALDTDPLYSIFTSGSTGVPKGVIVNHRSTIDFIDCFTETFRNY